MPCGTCRRAEYTGNEIISGILPTMESIKEAMAEASEMKGKLQTYLSSKNITNKDQMAALVIEDAKKINELLTTKSSPDEASQYKNWILDIAEDVAKSASEGGFLGFGGTQISEGEKALFGQMAAALGSDRILA